LGLVADKSPEKCQFLYHGAELLTYIYLNLFSGCGNRSHFLDNQGLPNHAYRRCKNKKCCLKSKNGLQKTDEALDSNKISRRFADLLL